MINKAGNQKDIFLIPKFMFILTKLKLLDHFRCFRPFKNDSNWSELVDECNQWRGGAKYTVCCFKWLQAEKVRHNTLRAAMMATQWAGTKVSAILCQNKSQNCSVPPDLLNYNLSSATLFTLRQGRFVWNHKQTPKKHCISISTDTAAHGNFEKKTELCRVRHI